MWFYYVWIKKDEGQGIKMSRWNYDDQWVRCCLKMKGHHVSLRKMIHTNRYVQMIYTHRHPDQQFESGDTTRGGWLTDNQFLHTLLTVMMSSNPGTVFFVPCMKLVNWQSRWRPWSCQANYSSASRSCTECRASAISSLGCNGEVAWVLDLVRFIIRVLLV